MATKNKDCAATSFILETASKYITKDHFEVSVFVNGVPYDVYWFERQEKIGQVALAIIDGKAVVSMFHVQGRLSEEVVTEKVRQSLEN